VDLACTPQAATAHVAQSQYAQIGRMPTNTQWGVPMCLSVQPGGKRTCALVSTPSMDIALGATCPTSIMPNAGGLGYYRFALEDTGWTALIRAAPTLSAAEQLALVHNVTAAFHAGQTSAATLLTAMAFTAPTASFALLEADRKMLHKLRASVLPQDQSAYRAF